MKGAFLPGVAGADQVFLLALACRRCGDETWNAFRAESATILGKQSLPGGVVVLVNRLAQPRRSAVR